MTKQIKSAQLSQNKQSDIVSIIIFKNSLNFGITLGFVNALSLFCEQFNVSLLVYDLEEI